MCCTMTRQTHTYTSTHLKYFLVRGAEARGAEGASFTHRDGEWEGMGGAGTGWEGIGGNRRGWERMKRGGREWEWGNRTD